MFEWKSGVDWNNQMEGVIFQLNKPGHKYGYEESCDVINYLCAHNSVTQAALKEAFDLTMDGVMTILSNVTMAIQGKGGGKVRTPESGGWYVTTDDPYSYIICPGFKSAWNNHAK